MRALTTTEAALLGLLAASEASGYDLKKAVESSVGYFWLPAKSQIYAVLPRLVADGLATRRAVAQPHRPDKHVYRISAQGRAALEDWLEEPAGEDSGRLLLKVFFGSLVDPDVVLRHVTEWRGRMEQLRDDLERMEAEAGDRPKNPYSALTRAYGLEYAHAVIRWTKGVERRLAHQRVRSR
jgi:DNA-binding PadR family transcriptional regulator